MLFGWKQCLMDKYDMIGVVVTLIRDTVWIETVFY